MPIVSSEDGSGLSAALLAGFEHRRIVVDGVTIACAIKGSGSPLLLLHGYPENHLTWRHVAAGLAEDHTVVLADLRGYGDSDKPVPDAAGLVYSKRSMAHDQVGLMRQLGFAQFQLVSHDRGARVAHRLVLDHPDAVTRLAILDILPTRYSYSHVTREVATANFFWFFMANARGVPEHMIGADPGYWLRAVMNQLLGDGASIEADVVKDYIRCLSDPRTVAGSCADFRASATTDLAHDEENAAVGQKLECPVLVLWGTQSTGSDPLSIWEQYASDVHTQAMPTGHFVPEEAPELVTGALRDFLD
jgi:haloacetate dehalogenase